MWPVMTEDGYLNMITFQQVVGIETYQSKLYYLTIKTRYRALGNVSIGTIDEHAKELEPMGFVRLSNSNCIKLEAVKEYHRKKPGQKGGYVYFEYEPNPKSSIYASVSRDREDVILAYISSHPGVIYRRSLHL